MTKSKKKAKKPKDRWEKILGDPTGKEALKDFKKSVRKAKQEKKSPNFQGWNRAQPTACSSRFTTALHARKRSLPHKME